MGVIPVYYKLGSFCRKCSFYKSRVGVNYKENDYPNMMLIFNLIP